WTLRQVMISGRLAGLISISCICLSWLFALIVFFQMAGGHEPVYRAYPWLVVGHLQVHFGFMVDPMTAVMLVVVTTVGAMVQIFSVGYMHGDPLYPRFFSYLSLFTT